MKLLLSLNNLVLLCMKDLCQFPIALTVFGAILHRRLFVSKRAELLSSLLAHRSSSDASLYFMPIMGIAEGPQELRHVVVGVEPVDQLLQDVRRRHETQGGRQVVPLQDLGAWKPSKPLAKCS
jgi:hypothetical protein